MATNNSVSLRSHQTTKSFRAIYLFLSFAYPYVARPFLSALRPVSRMVQCNMVQCKHLSAGHPLPVVVDDGVGVYLVWRADQAIPTFDGTVETLSDNQALSSREPVNRAWKCEQVRQGILCAAPCITVHKGCACHASRYIFQTLCLYDLHSVLPYINIVLQGPRWSQLKKGPTPPPHQKMRGQWSNDQGNQQMSTPPSRWTFENRFMTFSLQLKNSQEVSIPTTFSISRGYSCRLPPALPVARLGFLSCKRVRHSYSSSMWLVHRNCTIYRRDVLS